MTTRNSAVVTLCVGLVIALVTNPSSDARAHVDSPLLTDACGSCHVGHGASGEPMLPVAEEEFCYRCHGDDESRTAMVMAGLLSPAANLANVEQEFRKMYRHPVQSGVGHKADEVLPDAMGRKITHAECVDCHDPHQRMSSLKAGRIDVSGYSLDGAYLEKSRYEYEICFKCHLNGTSGPNDSQDLRAAFARGAGSQHPVTIPSDGTFLPSLKNQMASGSRMNCSDCHHSDDPDSPAGPHGSRYRYLLSGNYEADEFALESEWSFELCYGCHDRSSILANESFPLHREHIEGDQTTGVPGTSCRTCHASHGSPQFPHLLDFPATVVGRVGSGLPVGYRDLGQFSGECTLSCHGKEHDREVYR